MQINLQISIFSRRYSYRLPENTDKVVRIMIADQLGGFGNGAAQH